MDLDIRQIISQIVAFLLMFWILKYFAFGPILRLMRERQKKIEDEFASIAEQRRDAQAFMDVYKHKLQEIDTEGRRRIQQEIAKGRQIALEIQQQASRRADDMMDKAEKSIKQEVAQAKETEGRSVVVTFLGVDDPPRQVSVTTAGVSTTMP